MPAMIDEEPAHCLRRQRQPVRTAVQLYAAFVLQLQPGLVHERRRLQRVIGPLSGEISTRHPAQLAVDHREEIGGLRPLRRHLTSCGVFARLTHSGLEALDGVSQGALSYCNRPRSRRASRRSGKGESAPRHRFRNVS